MFDIDDLPLQNSFDEYLLSLLDDDILNYNADGSSCVIKDADGNDTNDSHKKRLLKTIFDNTLSLNYDTTVEPFKSFPNFNRDVIFPVLKRVMPNIIANEILGVQLPRTIIENKICQIHTLRVRYKNDEELLADIKAIEEQEFGLDPRLPKNIDKPTILASLKEQLDGGNRLSIQILKEIVEASDKKFQDKWAYSGTIHPNPKVDINAEILAALAQELIAEIDQDHLSQISEIAGNPFTTYDMLNVTGTPYCVGDVHAALAILINRGANLIAGRTRRGAGNWCIVSPTALTILQSATTSAFVRTCEGSSFVLPASTKFVGLLNGFMKVYVDQYADDRTPILIGYKGNEIDAAAFYSPRQFLTLDTSINDGYYRFERTDGLLPLENEPNSLGNAADYLSSVGINVDTLRFV